MQAGSLDAANIYSAGNTKCLEFLLLGTETATGTSTNKFSFERNDSSH